MKSKTQQRTKSRWIGKCGCGNPGNKVGGIISCDGCVHLDTRGGYGVQKSAGIRFPKRGELNPEIA